MPTHNALEHSIHFGQLYASAQSRDGDLAEFYAHAMQSFLHILSDFDNLHLPDTESDFLKTTNVSFLHEYADRIFIHHPEMQLQNAT